VSDHFLTERDLDIAILEIQIENERLIEDFKKQRRGSRGTRDANTVQRRGRLNLSAEETQSR